jgi:hypothetical protein
VVRPEKVAVVIGAVPQLMFAQVIMSPLKKSANAQFR